MVAGVISEVKLAAVAGKDVAAQSRRAAMSDSPKGAALLGGKRRIRFQELGKKTAQHPQDGGAVGHAEAEELCLAWQASAKLVHQKQSVLSALMGEVRVDHRAGDLGMPQQLLNGAEVGAGFKKVRGETMSQCVR